MALVNQELTHDEIWDDSALINSWDEALEEYKKYHSIHRNGGNVKDLLKPKPEEHRATDAKQSPDKIGGPSNDEEELNAASERKEDNLNNGQGVGNAATQNNHPRVSATPPAPAGLLGTVRDEGLKRLLMSWYYAGYYTGYYEARGGSTQNQEMTE
ncbi:hypothetical protein F4861DRAFT_500248 [Xylaria intraflava]|nr:hypothetical protein F4861DRAFT_500248 [Xylaria intraflava]